MKYIGIDRLIGYVKRPVSEEVVFKMLTSIKIALIPMITMIILFSLMWVILSMNLIFFEANGFAGVHGLKEAYYDHLSQRLLDSAHWIVIGIFIVALVGIYVSYLFLRPFRMIGAYCEEIVKNGTAAYDQELFSDLRLLTSFSEYFFNTMENALKRKKYSPIMIMKKYQKIHKPVFEKTFFIQLFIILLIISVAGGVILYMLAIDLNIELVKLSLQHLKSGPVNSHFFNGQKEIFANVINIVLVMHMSLYFFLCIHFHNMLAKPAFAIFATMRTFVKGGFNARIHLIGSRYMRPQSMKINKYLDYLQKNIEIIKDSELK